MTKRLSVLAITGLLAGASVFGLTQKPAAADGLSLNVGIPGMYVQYNDWRYHHDREYRDGYDRWHGDRHDDRGYRHGDHGDHHR